MQLKKTKAFFVVFSILMMDVFTIEAHHFGQQKHRQSVQSGDKYRKLIIDYIQENFVLDNGILNQPIDSRTSRVLNFLINQEGHSELLLSHNRISTKRLKQIYKKLKRDNYLLKLGQLMICKKINELINENFRSTLRSDLYHQLKEYTGNLKYNTKHTTQQFFQFVVTCMRKFKNI